LVIAGVAQSIPAVETPFSIEQPKLATDRRAGWRAVVNAGTVAAVLSLIPGLAVLALPLAGLICVLLYRRAGISEELTPGAGFRLGAKAGIAGSLILAAVRILTMLAMHAEDTVRTAAIEAVQRTGWLYSDQQIKDAVELLKSPGGLAACLIISVVVVCAIFALLCGIGGAVSAALLRRKLPPQ
jgi:hypothetical protein